MPQPESVGVPIVPDTVAWAVLPEPPSVEVGAPVMFVTEPEVVR